MRETCFINVDDALSCQHLVDQLQSELLPLVKAASSVRASCDWLCPLELQAELLSHDATDSLRADSPGETRLDTLVDLIGATYVTAPIQHLGYGRGDFALIVDFSLFLLLSFLYEVQILLARDATDEADRDVKLLGDVAVEAVLDADRVSDANEISGGQIAVATTLVPVAEVSLRLFLFGLFLCQKFPAF